MWGWLRRLSSTTMTTDAEAGGEDGDLSTSQVGSNNDENLSAKLMDPSPDMDPLQPHFNDIADTLNHRHHHNDEEEQQHKDNEDYESDRYNSLSLEESSLTTTTTALSAHRSSSLVRGVLPCAAYFFFEASISCVLPYLAVYYKELGFSTRTVGFLSSLGTFVSILGAPFWGAIADRTRKLSETMLVSQDIQNASLAGSFSHTAFLFVLVFHLDRLRFRWVSHFACPCCWREAIFPSL